MIERFLFNAINIGLDAIDNDPTILEDIFAQFNLATKEVDGIKESFATNRPGVKHQYANVKDDFPLYSIVLGSESEVTTFIGDDAGMITDLADEDYGADIKSSIWNHTYNTLCYSEHPDLTAYMYVVLKSIYLNADLSQCGLFDYKFSGGDLSPDTRYIPAHLFARQFTLTAGREFQRLDKESKLQKAFKVAGIHLDSGASPSDVGNVKTLVKIFDPSEDTDG